MARYYQARLASFDSGREALVLVVIVARYHLARLASFDSGGEALVLVVIVARDG